MRQKKKIFDFNYIDTNLDKEKLQQIHDLFRHYHKKNLDV